MAKVVIAFVFLAFVGLVSATNECDMDKMCPIPYTEEMQKQILNYHNMVRSKVNPTATNMEKMYWDDKMAEMALEHSKKCVFEHNTFAERRFDGYINVGQNLFASSVKPNATVPAIAWHAEVKDFTFGQSTAAVVGHYTQVVQGKAARIGCGGAYCPNNRLKYIVTCHYLRGQYNYITPYAKGTTCGSCPDKCQQNLCDCNGIVCQHGGRLNRNTCECSCLGLSTGNLCQNFKCHEKDIWYCSNFENICNVAYGYRVITKCPHRCGYCNSTSS